MRVSRIVNFFSKFNQKSTLLIPGPVTTSINVKKSAALDIGSREHRFVEVIGEVQKKILDIANVSTKNYSCVLFQGTGTYANEAVIGSYPKNTKMLTLSNGIYGDRLHSIANILNLDSKLVECDPLEKITVDILEKNLSDESHISLIHHETSNGIVNDVEEITKYSKNKDKTVLIDGISALGAIPINIEKLDIDYYVGSSNKCFHAFPGISFVIAKKKTLEKSKNISRSLSLDLYSQYNEFENNKQFRFTPPPQIINSLHTSLLEFEREGGVPIRYEQYKKRNIILRKSLEKMGLESCISMSNQGPIMVLFKYPWKNFDFNDFYLRLLEHNIVIYAAQIMNQDVIRLGNIGEISDDELVYCISCIKEELEKMKK